MSNKRTKQCLSKDAVISIYEAYGGSMALMKLYEPILDAPFLHALMSQLQLLNDRCAAQRTASLDWNTAAQPWLKNMPACWIPTAEIEPSMISALGGFLTTQKYVENIASKTSSGELFLFVEALNSALIGENDVDYNEAAWLYWSQCVVEAQNDPDLIKLRIASDK